MTDDTIVTSVIMGLVVLFVLATIIVAVAPRVMAYRRSQRRWKERQERRNALRPMP